MLHIVEISEIKVRAEAIGLSLKRLARLAGVDPSTAYAGARGNIDNRGSTLRKLADELARQEKRVADHIQKLQSENPEAAA
jgi:predicted transcriptional regulator